MNLNDFKGKKITIMGLGLHGGAVAVAKFLWEAGAKLTITDMKSREELKESLDKLKGCKNINFVFGQHRSEDFTSADIVIKNPMVPWSNKYVKLALSRNIPVEMDSSLFFKLCKNPIIGITGTKGKTTTASLIFEMLKNAGKNPVKVGVGQISVLDKLNDLKKENWVIFELSSWRLSALGQAKIGPKIAVITNIYPDHLNHYKTMEGYIKDKKNICLYQDKNDSCVISSDNEILKSLEQEIKARLIKFSKNKIDEGRAVYVDNGIVYYNDGIDEKKVTETEKINLPGEHNLENVLAAVAAAVAAGADLPSIRKAILEFKNIAHRMELVHEINGVKYINDTAATMPEAAIYAINSIKSPIILICGGSDKNLNMEEFGRLVAEKIKGAIFFKGAGTDKIITAIKKADGKLAEEEFKIVESMEKAVELANSVASPGDVVLLSPGAASFGIFANEFDRGNKFKEAVKNLK